MTISERIFELIRERGYTQKEFSKKTGIAESTISDWKKKGTNPVSDKILIICEVLEVSPYYLLSGIENKDGRSRVSKAPEGKAAKAPEAKIPAKDDPEKAEAKKPEVKKAEAEKPEPEKAKDEGSVTLQNIATVARDEDDYNIAQADGGDKKDKKDKKKKKDKEKDKDKDKKKKKDKDKKKKKGYLITY